MFSRCRAAASSCQDCTSAESTLADVARCWYIDVDSKHFEARSLSEWWKSKTSDATFTHRISGLIILTVWSYLPAKLSVFAPQGVLSKATTPWPWLRCQSKRKIRSMALVKPRSWWCPCPSSWLMVCGTCTEGKGSCAVPTTQWHGAAWLCSLQYKKHMALWSKTALESKNIHRNSLQDSPRPYQLPVGPNRV